MTLDKLTYTPAEFAALFNKERTWAYRQLYAGKIKAVTKLGQIHIPKSEVEKLLADVERYRGSPSHLKRTATRKARKSAPVSKGALGNGARPLSRERNAARRLQRMLVPKVAVDLHRQHSAVAVPKPARNGRYINA